MTRHSRQREGIAYEVLLNHWWPRLLGHGAWTFARRIYCADRVLVAALHRHEFRHLKQQQELGLWQFAWRYLWESRLGYKEISFEVDAYYAQAHPEVYGEFEDVGP